ncbi:MAG: hypothetical protein FWF88_00675 [Peptococcaceae bacterium]|nr:hypothetical protein [Peptococcaceae bacterium]
MVDIEVKDLSVALSVQEELVGSWVDLFDLIWTIHGKLRDDSRWQGDAHDICGYILDGIRQYANELYQSEGCCWWAEQAVRGLDVRSRDFVQRSQQIRALDSV